MKERRTHLEQRTCQYCGKVFEFYNPPCFQNTKRGRYCSRQCAGKAYNKLPDDIDSIIRTRISAGEFCSDIATDLGCSQSLIAQHAHALDIPLTKSRKGERNGMYGRTHTPEARAKISAANKRQFSDPMARERHALLTCKQIQEGRTGKSYNRLEQTVAGMLKDRNISYLQQYRVGRYVFDFFLPASNTLIEVNGRFWHADPRFYNHTSLSPVQVHNTANDIRKAIRALQDGFSIRILWEDDIKDGSAII